MSNQEIPRKVLILGGGYAWVMAASRLVINGVRAEITRAPKQLAPAAAPMEGRR